MASNAFTGRTASISTDPKKTVAVAGSRSAPERSVKRDHRLRRAVLDSSRLDVGAAGRSRADATSGRTSRAASGTGPFGDLLPEEPCIFAKALSNPAAYANFGSSLASASRIRSPIPLGRAASADGHRSQTIQRSVPPPNAAGRPATALRAGSASLITPSPLALALS
jgi:hypothetical protein